MVCAHSWAEALAYLRSPPRACDVVGIVPPPAPSLAGITPPTAPGAARASVGGETTGKSPAAARVAHVASGAAVDKRPPPRPPPPPLSSLHERHFSPSAAATALVLVPKPAPEQPFPAAADAGAGGAGGDGDGGGSGGGGGGEEVCALCDRCMFAPQFAKPWTFVPAAAGVGASEPGAAAAGADSASLVEGAGGSSAESSAGAAAAARQYTEAAEVAGVAPVAHPALIEAEAVELKRQRVARGVSAATAAARGYVQLDVSTVSTVILKI